jgi:serine/threonine protein kinase
MNTIEKLPTAIESKPKTSLNLLNVQQIEPLGDLKKKDIMEVYLRNNCPTFNENFELVDYLDSGSTGIVYKGKSKNSRDNKLFSFKFCIRNRNQKNKYHEIIHQKSLHNKYISEILAFYKINNTDYFSVSELGKYGNIDAFMHKFLKRNYLSETFINYIAKQILEGLNYMHRAKLVHMDIKKGNIVLDSEMNIKLIDFSSAFSFKNYEPNEEIKLPLIGTARYMSPEILNREKIKVKFFEKIDIYSLGVTLYNLAFGFYPYNLNNVQGNDYQNIGAQILNNNLQFPRNSGISKKFENFLRAILEKDYEKRYNIKKALEDPWIKGWDIINEEKENTEQQENFVIRLVSDNIPKFNKYIQ